MPAPARPASCRSAGANGRQASGWAVSPGERYRFRSPTGIRVTTARLEPADALALADDIAGLGRAPAATYAG